LKFIEPFYSKLEIRRAIISLSMACGRFHDVFQQDRGLTAPEKGLEYSGSSL